MVLAVAGFYGLLLSSTLYAVSYGIASSYKHCDCKNGFCTVSFKTTSQNMAAFGCLATGEMRSKILHVQNLVIQQTIAQSQIKQAMSHFAKKIETVEELLKNILQTDDLEKLKDALEKKTTSSPGSAGDWQRSTPQTDPPTVEPTTVIPPLSTRGAAVPSRIGSSCCGSGKHLIK